MPESLTPELVALRDRVQAFIDDELRPLEALQLLADIQKELS